MLRPVALGILALAVPVAAAPPLTIGTVGGGKIDLAVDSGGSTPEIESWVRRAATAVSSFYGRFPVAHLKLTVARVSGRRIFGTTFGGHLIRMQLGTDATATALEHDWTLTHEMLHLGFPSLDHNHHWMEEGEATYFEPIARVRAGNLEVDRYWKELLGGLPQGLPDDGDEGLDRTPTWGRTYWGGALFWFLADLEIREATQNRRSADDALRAILAAGGDGESDWPIERVLATGDRATGTKVLASLYDRMATHPFPVDIGALSARLGVHLADGAVSYDDAAPLAAIRRSMTSASENGRR